MQRSKRDVEAGLQTKGFVRDERHHHFFIYHTADGKRTLVKTRTSHSGRDIGVALLKQMAKQCSLSKEQFLALVDCPLSRDEFERILADLDVL